MATFSVPWVNAPAMVDVQQENPSRGWPLLGKDAPITFSRGKAGGKEDQGHDHLEEAVLAIPCEGNGKLGLMPAVVFPPFREPQLVGL